MPDLASFGKQRLEGRIAYLATVRPERLAPCSPRVSVLSGNDLCVYMEPTSPKVLDMRRNARYAMHCAVEDDSGGQGEFFVTGRAVEVDDAKTSGQAFEDARMMAYSPQERHVLFELRIEEAMATVYENSRPKRSKWGAP